MGLTPIEHPDVMEAIQQLPEGLKLELRILEYNTGMTQLEISGLKLWGIDNIRVMSISRARAERRAKRIKEMLNELRG